LTADPRIIPSEAGSRTRACPLFFLPDFPGGGTNSPPRALRSPSRLLHSLLRSSTPPRRETFSIFLFDPRNRLVTFPSCSMPSCFFCLSGGTPKATGPFPPPLSCLTLSVLSLLSFFSPHWREGPAVSDPRSGCFTFPFLPSLVPPFLLSVLTQRRPC